MEKNELYEATEARKTSQIQTDLAADPEEELRYQRFLNTKQETLRLSEALAGFFSESQVSERAQTAYRAYLKKRIRPAAERLLREGETDRLMELERRGMFGASELDAFILCAQKLGREAAVIALLQLKDQKYGYRDRDFSF